MTIKARLFINYIETQNIFKFDDFKRKLNVQSKVFVLFFITLL